MEEERVRAGAAGTTGEGGGYTPTTGGERGGLPAPTRPFSWSQPIICLDEQVGELGDCKGGAGGVGGFLYKF